MFMGEKQTSPAKSLVGACGVFYVSAELSKRGWIAMPTIRNTSGIDIVASRDNRVVNIQVKTNSYGRVRYPMTKRNEEYSDDLYYVFVTLKGEDERPDFYVLSSKIVADYIRKTHEKWSTLEPKRRLRKHTEETKTQRQERRKESSMRQFPNPLGKDVFKDFDIEHYKDNWEILEK